MSATLFDVMVTVRELSFDRFPLSTFTIKKKASGWTITTNASSLVIKNGATTVLTANYATYDSLQLLTDYLIAQGFPIAYSGYFLASEESAYILPNTDLALSKNVNLMRRFFYSDETLKVFIQKYFSVVLRMTLTISELADAIAVLEDSTVRHLCLWVAISTLNARRMHEIGAASFGDYFTDGSGLQMKGNVGYPGDTVNVNIGSVFSMSQDNTASSDYFSESYNLPGSDNVLGDKESFWFKLYLYLRNLIEAEYSDYNFRPETGMVTKMVLDKPINLRSYYDSYPYTLSPLSRGILP